MAKEEDSFVFVHPNDLTEMTMSTESLSSFCSTSSGSSLVDDDGDSIASRPYDGLRMSTSDISKLNSILDSITNRVDEIGENMSEWQNLRNPRTTNESTTDNASNLTAAIPVNVTANGGQGNDAGIQEPQMAVPALGPQPTQGIPLQSTSGPVSMV